MTRGIYSIRCALNGCVYIGSSINIERRWKIHRWDLGVGHHRNSRLQRAWNKYGPDAFSFTILEVVGSIDALLEAEQRWIDRVPKRVRFNLCPPGCTPSPLGIKRSEETKEKIRRANLGKVMTDKARESLRRASANGWRKGRKHTPESIEKMRRAKLGKKLGKQSSEHKALRIKPGGWKHTDETREKMRRSWVGRDTTNMRGWEHSKAAREKMRQAKLGGRLSDEHRANIRQGVLASIERKRGQKID